MVEHPAALTTQEADYYIEGMEGVRTKSMFLTNKKKTAFYLLIMDDQKQLDMEALRKWLVPTAFAWIQATVSGKRCDCLRGQFPFFVCSIIPIKIFKSILIGKS